MTSPPLLLVRQFCEAVNISLPMGYKIIHQGKIPIIQIGSAIRIHPDDCSKFIEERRGQRSKFIEERRGQHVPRPRKTRKREAG
jgi:excisionase family DNA binding protein